MKFLKDTRGNIAITSAIMGTVLLTASGAAVDGGRFITTKQKLQSIADAAALAAMTPEFASESKRVQIAQTAVDSYTKGQGGTHDFSDPDLAFNLDGSVATLSLSTNVPMLFSAFLPQKSGRVSVVSRVEENYAADTNALSISVVLDLSDSMAGEFDNQTKLAAVQAAVRETLTSIESQFGGKAAAATRVSTGIYPFNWGLVDGDAVPLSPGTDNVLDQMTYTSLANGSVSSAAMEAAVSDQIAESLLDRDRDRFIFYISDGKVDEDKSDTAGRYLRDIEMYESFDVKNCLTIGADLMRTDLQISPEEAAAPTGTSPLRDAVQGVNTLVGLNDGDNSNWNNRNRNNNNGNNNDDDDDDDQKSEKEKKEKKEKDRKKDRKNKGDKHAGHDHGDEPSTIKADHVDRREDYLETCRPVQAVRVAEACEIARDAGVTIVGVNLSQEDGPATNIMDVCINGLTERNMRPTNKRMAQLSLASEDGTPEHTRTTPSGMSLNVSADGKSFTGDVTNMTEMREMLATILPKSDKTRKVRLIS